MTSKSPLINLQNKACNFSIHYFFSTSIILSVIPHSPSQRILLLKAQFFRWSLLLFPLWYSLSRQINCRSLVGSHSIRVRFCLSRVFVNLGNEAWRNAKRYLTNCNAEDWRLVLISFRIHGELIRLIHRIHRYIHAVKYLNSYLYKYSHN